MQKGLGERAEGVVERAGRGGRESRKGWKREQEGVEEREIRSGRESRKDLESKRWDI